MATTQTTLQAPFETIALENRNQNEDLPEIRRAGRVFEADPAFTTSPASRRLIISLLVCANTIQVIKPSHLEFYDEFLIDISSSSCLIASPSPAVWLLAKTLGVNQVPARPIGWSLHIRKPLT